MEPCGSRSRKVSGVVADEQQFSNVSELCQEMAQEQDDIMVPAAQVAPQIKDLHDLG